MHYHNRWLSLSLLGLANFMVILDSQIVLVALPSMEKHLGLTPQEGQWVLTANLLTFGGLLLLGGRAADLLGRRRVFQIGTALYMVISLLSGLAQSGTILVTARFLHGVAAALMAPTALSILTTTSGEGAARNKALAVWSGIGGLGATSGLLIGGALTQSLGWRWVFLVNVPVAAIMLAASPFLLPETQKGKRHGSFDLTGAVTVTASLTVLIYAIVDAPSSGWTAASTMGLLALAAALLVVFVVVEVRSSAPLLPLKMLRSAKLVGGNVGTITAAMAAIGMSYVVALYTQEVLGYSPLHYGFSTSAMPVAAVIGAFAAQWAITRTNTRLVGAASFVITGAGLLLLAQIPVAGLYLSDLFPGLVLFGIGLGGTTVACSVAALTRIADREQGLASGMNSASFQIGGALGVAVISTVVASATAGPGAAAMTSAFHAGFVVCAAVSGAGLIVTLTLLGRDKARQASADGATSLSHAAYGQAEPVLVESAELNDTLASATEG